MISQKTLKQYQYNSIIEFYAEVYNSLVNGQFGQAKEYIKNMDKKQRIDFYSIFIKDLSDDDLKNKLTLLLIEVSNGR